MMPVTEGTEEGDSVPLFGDGTRDDTRRHNQVYDWSLTKHRYFFPGERQPPSDGLSVSSVCPISSHWDCHKFDVDQLNNVFTISF